jgi:prepilin-type N-terminal cleavage/methylation domain-containing protein
MLMQPYRLSGEKPRQTRLRQSRLRQSGMTLIELMIAMAVLSIGMLGSVGMILAGIQSNARNKNDSTAVVLDQEILEMFSTLNNYPTTGTVTISDCGLTGGAATSHLASLVQGAAPTGNGAVLYTAGTAPVPANVGDINWTVAAPTLATSVVAGYAMDYVACNGDTFEVRWNVMQVNPNPPGSANSRISLLTVSSRQTTSKGSGSGMLFAVPTTIKTLID